MNVASKKYRASCSASSEYDDRFKCDNALDETSNDWAPRVNARTDAWIQIHFTGAFYIVEVLLKSRFNTADRVKDVSISIGNMLPQSVCIIIL